MAGTQRSREKEVFWRSVVEKQRLSGVGVREFCRLQGLAEPSFYAWRREIAKRDGPSAGKTKTDATKTGKKGGENGAAFIPVEVIDQRSVSKQAADVLLPPSRHLEIVTPGGFTLRFDGETDLHRVGEVLTAVARLEAGGAPC
jgi:hypothetical protein